MDELTKELADLLRGVTHGHCVSILAMQQGRRPVQCATGNNGSIPNRLVVHKSSRFVESELRGFESACKTIPQHDFVSFGFRWIQFYRTGAYPPLRGSYVKFSDSEFTLYTDG